MLDDLLPLLACPHCGAPLERSGGSVSCPAGHSFDIARQGYLGLLPGDALTASADTAAMVEARAAFLEAGHFDPLAAALAGTAEDALAGGPDGAVADLGAGTGWYLAHVLERLPERRGLALDLSKHALRRAAHAHPGIGAVACDAWRRLPLQTGSVALVLSVFAPRDGAELARVLRPGGALAVVTPTRRHLAELVSALGLLTVDSRKGERLRVKLDPYLDLERRIEREWTMQLTRADVASAVAMGPSARHEQRAAILPDPVAVTASLTLSVYRRAAA